MPNISWTSGPEANITCDRKLGPSTEQRFAKCVRDTFFYQHITENTRYRKGQCSTLDGLLFTNEASAIQQLKCLDPLGASDHTGIKFKIPFIYCTPKKIKKKFFTVKEIMTSLEKC